MGTNCTCTYLYIHKKLCLSIRKHFVTVQVAEQWHRLHRGCGLSSLGTSKSCLDVALCTLLCGKALLVLSSLSHSVVLRTMTDWISLV